MSVGGGGREKRRDGTGKGREAFRLDCLILHVDGLLIKPGHLIACLTAPPVTPLFALTKQRMMRLGIGQSQ